MHSRVHHLVYRPHQRGCVQQNQPCDCCLPALVSPPSLCSPWLQPLAQPEEEPHPRPAAHAAQPLAEVGPAHAQWPAGGAAGVFPSPSRLPACAGSWRLHRGPGRPGPRPARNPPLSPTQAHTRLTSVPHAVRLLAGPGPGAAGRRQHRPAGVGGEPPAPQGLLQGQPQGQHRQQQVGGPAHEAGGPAVRGGGREGRNGGRGWDTGEDASCPTCLNPQAVG